MNKNSLFFITGIFGLLALGQAQEPTPPPNPQVAAVPESVHWELVTLEKKPVEAKTPDDANPNNLKRVEVTRTGNIQKVVVSYANGINQETWVSGSEMFVEINNAVSSGTIGPMVPQFYAVSPKYFGAEWVTAKNFKKRVTSDKRELDLYETDEPAEAEKYAVGIAGFEARSSKTIRQAYIDTETRLPVVVVAPEGTLYYKFLPPPAIPLQLPEQFTKKQREREAEVRRQQAEASVR